MRKRIVVLWGIMGILLMGGCGTALNDLKTCVNDDADVVTDTKQVSDDDTEKSETGFVKEVIEEATEEREVYVSVSYEPNLFTKPSNNLEITIYIDGIKVETANIGELKDFLIYDMKPGKHTLKTVRNILDTDSCEFEVAEDTYTYIGMSYKFNSLVSNGELETSDYVMGNDDQYTIFSIAANGVDSVKLDRKAAVDLTEYIESAKNPAEFKELIYNAYHIQMEKSSGYEGMENDNNGEAYNMESDNGKNEAFELQYFSPAGKLIVGNDQKGKLCIYVRRAYTPLYVVDGLWCGMNFEKAYQELEKKYGEEDIEIGGFNANGNLIAIGQEGDRVGYIIFIKDYLIEDAYEQRLLEDAYDENVFDENLKLTMQDREDVPQVVDTPTYSDTIALENYIDFSLSADQMGELLQMSGLDFALNDDCGYYCSGDESVWLFNTDMGGSQIEISPSENNLYSIFGVSCGMSVEDVWNALEEYDAVEVTSLTASMNYGASIYTLFDSYTMIINYDEDWSKVEGITFDCYLW